MNVYGWWEYMGDVPIETNNYRIDKGDIISVHSRHNEELLAFCKGEAISFQKIVLKKCKRPIRGHKPSSCLAKGMFGSDCKKCATWKKKRQCIST